MLESDAPLHQIFIFCVTGTQHTETPWAYLPDGRSPARRWAVVSPPGRLLGLPKQSVSHTCCYWAAGFWVTIKSCCFLLLVIKKKKQDFPVSEQGARLPRDGLKGREMNWEHNVCAFDQWLSFWRLLFSSLRITSRTTWRKRWWRCNRTQCRTRPPWWSR